MKKDDLRARNAALLGALPVVWLALLDAPYFSGGLPSLLAGLTAAERPFAVRLCADSPRAVLVFLSAYALAVCVLFSSRRNYRRRGHLP